MPHRPPRSMFPAVACSLLFVALAPGLVRAQAGVDDFGKPILVRSGLGHVGPIRALAFAPGETELLSAGYDRVIHVWDAAKSGDRPLLTLRPPVFGGPSGQIFALAVSPTPLSDGRRLVAVGGRWPLQKTRAEGSVVVMSYAREQDRATGRYEGRLQVQGALSRVLVFTTDGERLVAATEDGKIVVWDARDIVGRIAAAVPLHTLQPLLTIENKITSKQGLAEAKIYTMAVHREPGRFWAVTGDEWGQLRRWDLNAPAGAPPLDIKPAKLPIRGITALSLDRDAATVYYASEGGAVAAVSLAPPVVERELRKLPAALDRVHSLDLSPDGGWLAASIQEYRSDRGVRLDHGSVVLISTAAGNAPLQVHSGRHLVGAVRFGRDSLAYGGDADFGLQIRAWPDLRRERALLTARGSVVWDVGFARDTTKTTVLFSRVPDHYARRASGEDPVEALNLTDGRVESRKAGEMHRTPRSIDGWRIEEKGHSLLHVVSPDGRSRPLPLPEQWMSWCLIPPPPPAKAGDPPLLAVGHMNEVHVYELVKLVGTRVLLGHEADVTAIEVSPDRKWLVTASADATVRLWRIDGFETLPPFGAELAPDGAELVVRNVAPDGMADLAGLKADDRISAAEVLRDSGREVVPLDRVARLLAEEPVGSTRVGLLTPRVQVFTRRTTPPTLSFFVDTAAGSDHVVWTPRGLYDASLKGDSRYLGFHTNELRVVASSNFDDTTGTRFDPIRLLEKELRRPEDVRKLLAGALVKQPDPPKPPPAPPVVVRKEIEQEIHVEFKPDQKPVVHAGPRELPIDGVRQEKTDDGRIRLRIPIDRVKDALVSVYVALDDRVSATRTLPTPDLATDEPGRLRILSLGVETFPAMKLPGVPLAAADAKALPEFLVERLIDRDGATFKPDDRAVVPPFTDPVSLRDAIAKPGLFPAGAHPRDLLVLVIETRALWPETADPAQVRLLSAKSDPKRPETSLGAHELAALLGRFTEASGARVIVFLDDVHDRLETTRRDARMNFLRALDDARITAFVAGEDTPSLPTADGGDGYENRLFARSILGVFENAAEDLTLKTFKDRVVRRVKETGGDMRPRLIVPVVDEETAFDSTPFLKPAP